MDIGQWLTTLGLEDYVQAFADHRVDAATLPLLSMDDLKEIGVLPVGDRRKILAAAAALAGSAESGTDSVPESGSPEGHGGTRRQVTVLFADIAGFTELSARLDAEQLHAVLTAYFEEVDGIIGRLGGTIDKHIGDSVMAVFGAPVAHADDVHRSVQAALRIHTAMAQVSARCGQQLGVHAGIATGEVIASLTGSHRHREYTVTGDTVNLAARLTGLARSGETVVSTGVVEALGDELLAEPMGSHAIKGLTEPVAAWRVVGMAPDHGRGSRPMFGRRAELAQCRTALESVLADRRGAVIYIRGEAGIGKTRLLQAVFEAAAGLGFATHRCSVFDFGTGLEVDPLRAVGLTLHGAQAEAGALPLPLALKDLLGLPLSLEERGLLDAMPHEARATGRADSLAELTIASALAQPVLIGIEDVHWADATTLDGIDLLARTAPARSPTVLVMTSRLEEDPLAAAQVFLGGLSLLVIELGRLHEQDARALAESLLGDANPVIDECMGRAEGNPLFLEQLVRHARSDGVGSAIPGSIRSVVLAQADRLPAIDRAAARCAAVLGDQFSVAALRHLLQRPGYEADRLVGARLIRPDKDMLQFTHALIRDSLYSSILHAERRTLHGRAAGWFDGRDSSLHAEHLARADDPSAVPAFIAAARELDQAFRPEAAMDRIRRGTAVARTPADHFALALEEGALLRELGRAAEAAAVYDRAIDTAPDAVGLASAKLGKAAALRVIDRVDEALQLLDEAAPAFVEAGDDAALARLEHLRGNLLFPRGRREECRIAHQRALEHARRAGDGELEARALGGLGDAAYAAGRYASASDYFGACVTASRARGLGRVEIANAPMLAAVHAIYGDPERVIAEVDAGIAAAVSARQPRAELIGQHIGMMTHLWAGHPERVAPYFERAEALVAQIGARRFKPENLAFMAEACRQLGDRPRSIALAAEAVPICRETGMQYVGAMVLGYQALAAHDDERVRRAALDEGEALALAGGIAHNALFFGQAAIESALLAGAWDEARRYADGLDRAFLDEPVPFLSFIAERGRVLADRGERPGDASVLERMAACAEVGRRFGYGYFLPALEAPVATAQPVA